MSQPPFRPDHGQWGPDPARAGGPGFAPHRGQAPPLRRVAPGSPRRWPWIAGIAGAFVVGAVLGSAVTAQPTTAPVAADVVIESGPPPLVGGIAEPSYQGPFRLEASSALGRELTGNYDNGTGGMDSFPQGTAGTWSTTVEQDPNGYSSGSLSVSSSPSVDEYMAGDPASDTVTCRVTDATGQVVAEETGAGQSAHVNCFGY